MSRPTGYITIVATYASGRKEEHKIKKTKTANNRAVTKKITALRSIPTIVNISVEKGEQ